MAKPPSVAVRPLPRWIPAVGSAVLAFHLLAVLMLSVSAPSGPWPLPGMGGIDRMTGPEFANAVNNIVYPIYLRPLGMIHNYHFVTDATAADGIELEIILRDEGGAEIKRLKLPEPDANPWVRHRQRLLAQQLLGDMPVPQRGAEKVALKGSAVAQVDYWLQAAAIKQLIEETKDKDGNVVPPPVIHPEAQKKLREKLELFSHMTQPAADAPRLTLPGAGADASRSIPVDAETRARISLPGDFELPPGMGQMRPSTWSLILAKSYLRHLCTRHHAHSAELIRHSRPAILPPLALMEQPLPGSFTELIVNFGDLKRDLEEGHK